MKNPFENYFTPTEQKTILFLMAFAFIGFCLEFTHLKAEEKDSVNESVKEAIKTDKKLQIDIRTATIKELTSLPGIGISKAKKIITFREEEGFLKTSDIMKISGFGQKTYEKLLPNLIIFGEDELLKTNNEFKAGVEEKASYKININTATIEELMKLNGIGRSRAKKIIELRKRLGKFEQIEQLTQIKGIGIKTLEKNKGRIVLE